MALISDVTAAARTLLNDDGASVWDDASLLPKVKEAHRELQSKLWIVGSPVVREQSDPITVLTGATDLGANQPADLLAPFDIVEYAAASTPDTAVPMTEKIFLPLVAQATTLKYWSWRKEKITFVGATADRKVIVYYRKSITLPTAVGDPVGILFGELYLSARVAALAAGSVGNKDVYAIMTSLSETRFGLVLQSQRGQQSPATRP